MLESETTELGLARIFGTSYQLTSGDPLDQDMVPCALCQLKPPQEVAFMLPGTTVCPTGWNVQYIGDLMADTLSDTSPQTTYICVTDNRSGRDISGSSGKSKLGPVQVTCNNELLPCTDYPTHALVTCVVCSR